MSNEVEPSLTIFFRFASLNAFNEATSLEVIILTVGCGLAVAWIESLATLRE